MKIKKDMLEKLLVEYATNSYNDRRITRRGKNSAREFINKKLKQGVI